jgi:hypothetical protein
MTNQSKNKSGPIWGTIVTVILIIGCVLTGPIVGIWALNTLFPQLMIPYTVLSWSAFMALIGILHIACAS